MSNEEMVHRHFHPPGRAAETVHVLLNAEGSEFVAEQVGVMVDCRRIIADMQKAGLTLVRCREAPDSHRIAADPVAAYHWLLRNYVWVDED